MQSDGNFVVYGSGGVVMWSTPTGGNNGTWIAMQSDGNLVVYAVGGVPKWSSSTAPSIGDSLVLQDDGNLVIYSEGGRPLWNYGGGVVGTPDTLNAGQTLTSGQALWSRNGHYEAVMQPDGNFVLYAAGTPTWGSATTGNPGATITMQTDGNLVVYSAGGVPKWSSASAPSGGDWLVMQNDGNLIVYSKGGVVLWDNHDGKIGAEDSLFAGQALAAGQALWSLDGRYEAAMQGDGNFVLYAPGGVPRWASGTGGNPGAHIAMQSDGNLVIYTASGTPIWSSLTAPSSGDHLAMQSDGNLVIYSGSQALWSALTSAPSPAAAAAVQYAKSWLGKEHDSGDCLAFVEEAYNAGGVNIGTGGTAVNYWNSDPKGYAKHAGDTNPPIGALVFWGATTAQTPGVYYDNPDGHVGIYIGQNEVISTSAWPYDPNDSNNVFEFPLTGAGSRNAKGYPYLGWMLPG